MRVSKEKAAEHRAAIVSAAGRLFREKGIDGVGVAEITRAAGLTHGGFYGHFASKEALAAEACLHSFQEKSRAFDGGGDVAGFIDAYLSENHLYERGTGCPMPALAGEVARQDPASGLGASFAAGFSDHAALLESLLPEGDADRDQRAFALLSLLVGAVSLARAVKDSNPTLARTILSAAHQQTKTLAGLA